MLGYDQINYNVIASAGSADARLRAVQTEVDRVSYISLTDALVNRDNGGQLILQYLEDSHKTDVMRGKSRTWKIQVLRDEWGRKPGPGDTVIWRFEKPLIDVAGRPLRSNVIQDMKRRGTFEREYVEKIPFELDEYNCMTCTYHPSIYFLSEFGVHYNETKAALCGRREVSSGQCRAPDNSMRHIWYWRYQEVPPWINQESISQNSKNKKNR